jgi:hypothetical protein
MATEILKNTNSPAAVTETSVETSAEEHTVVVKALHTTFTEENLSNLMEDLKAFHNNSKRDEQTQKNGKMFEQFVKNKLLAFGYSDVTGSTEPLYEKILAVIKKNYITQKSIPNSYNMELKKILFHQPYGSQAPPDFLLVDILKDTIHFQPVEVKSGKKAATWNNNYPKDDWIYIFSGNDGVTYFLGKNIITQDVKNIFEEYKKVRKELTASYNTRLKEMGANWKLVDYFKFEHTGKVHYTKDEQRTDREKDVSDVLLMLTNLAF